MTCFHNTVIILVITSGYPVVIMNRHLVVITQAYSLNLGSYDKRVTRMFRLLLEERPLSPSGMKPVKLKLDCVNLSPLGPEESSFYM